MNTVVIKYKANRAFVKLKLFILKLVCIYIYTHCILYNIYYLTLYIIIYINIYYLRLSRQTSLRGSSFNFE